MKDETPVRFMRVLIEVVDPVRVEQGGSALYSVNQLSLLE